MTGLRVTDFTWVVAGPFCTRALADMGAEVIKIEARIRPDPMRNTVNSYDDLDSPFPYGAFDSYNRNKLGAAINARHPEGLKLIKDLIAVSDAVTENFRGGVLERWGLSYEEMRQARPDIVCMALSGYGQAGPYQSYASHFHMAQALPGFTSLSGYEGDVPVVAGASGDTTSGLHAAVAVLSALEHRRMTGQGQYIDASQLTSMASVMGSAYLEYTANGNEPRPSGNRPPHTSPIVEGSFRCKGEDRWVAIGVYTEDEWLSFCDVIERRDLTNDPKFADDSDRGGNWRDLEVEVEKWTGAVTAEEAMTALQNAGIGAAVVENVQDLMERDDQLAHRGYYVDAWHPDREVGTLRMDGIVPKFSDTPGEVRRAAPTIGEHNEYVFGEVLGLSSKRLRELQEAGVFF
ncbi:MAG: CoA transferase [SAR202 cluster bacterium]|nr:CoA transferase [SAR202 cluster bacterium]MDP6513446.1 CoA transferase [SAR202 cluster bacterium]MDP6716183.1 CoA transferase [SAR202 cluster bacterium]